MKREGFVATTVLAFFALAGVSLQYGSKSEQSTETPAMAGVTNPSSKTGGKGTNHSTQEGETQKGCSGLQSELADFLDVDVGTLVPEHCLVKQAAHGPSGSAQTTDRPKCKKNPALEEKTKSLKFVIALLPDPAHTHLSAQFDQFAVAIQEGGQDEEYVFDSSWLPWDDDEPSYPRLKDQQISSQEREFKENEPGVILFRPELAESNSNGLVVFVVGEEATGGIHRRQFSHAVDWITTLSCKAPIAILGPTFSGSIPSLEQLLSNPENKQILPMQSNNQPLPIYSGSVSSRDAARNLAKYLQIRFGSKIVFHSFVQDDHGMLERLFRYMCTKQKPGFGRVAILSEDETAYGGDKKAYDVNEKTDGGDKLKETICPSALLVLYYPRDISALREAYQEKSLFGADTSSSSTAIQRRSLPSDLTDPTGKVHDSIRSYGKNQTPLAQEAILTEIVAELHDHRAEYIILRGSNRLDQLFLANFLRRSYPDGRIIILGSDLMFIRERGATGLSGVMTLNTYPLFPLEHEWTEHQPGPATQRVVRVDRVFSSDLAEGTYVAFRLLLNDKSLNSGERKCYVSDTDEKLFLPHVSCAKDHYIPDYSPPFWMLTDRCGEMQNSSECQYLGPPTWLSVVGGNRFWPVASLLDETSVQQRTTGPASSKMNPAARPAMPAEMKVLLLLLAGLALFHLSCCWYGSYTGKPSFRAYFANQGELPHFCMVFGGSCCIAVMAVFAGWGAGIFHTPDAGLIYPWFALWCVAFTVLAAGLATVADGYIVRISTDPQSWLASISDRKFVLWACGLFGLFIIVAGRFCLVIVGPLEYSLTLETRVLTYWRAMHILSSVSPIVPIISIVAGLYLLFWFALHGLALFGPDRPRLPAQESLGLPGSDGKRKEYLRMFSHEGVAGPIEKAAFPLNWKEGVSIICIAILFFAVSDILAGEAPVRSLGSRNYSTLFLTGLDISCVLAIVLAWRLLNIWQKLKQLLTFLNRLTLRRSMAALQGFSWESVWRMSGNVLDVRYKIISRQMECMNHTIAALEDTRPNYYYSNYHSDEDSRAALKALLAMRKAGMNFAEWYTANYSVARAGNLESFGEFQESVAETSGVLLAKLLVPAWRKEKESLVVKSLSAEEKKEGPKEPELAADLHIRNAEELVCLTYLAFVQNVLGYLRITVLAIVALFLTCTLAVSTYPFDPRQALTTVLVALFIVLGAAIVKMYADMHRDSTLSIITNTNPGELGAEFWFKIIGLGFAPLAGLLVRLFPNITDFVFSWLQPSISSLK